MYLLIITIAGLLFRLVLANQSFWLDEGASIEIASRPFLNLVFSMKGDFHPPLFYLLLKSWLPYAGHSEILIRLPGILIGTATIPVLYLLTKEFLPNKKSFLVYLPSLLLALNPYHVYYSQELRMYGLNAFFTLLTWLYFVKLQKDPRQKHVVLFTIFTTLNLYTFYGAFFNLLAQVIYSLIYKKEVEKVILSSVLTVFFFLPWMPILLEQFKNGGYLTTALPGWSALSGTLTLKDLLLIPAKFIFGRINFSPKALYYLLGGIDVVILGGLIYLSSKQKQIRPILFYFFMPLICAVIISLKTPVLGYWRYTSIVPALMILMAFGIYQLPKKFIRPSIIFITTAFLIFNIIFWKNADFQREDWKNLAKYIRRDNSLVVLNFPITFAPLKYYLPDADYFYSQTTLGKVRDDMKDIFIVPAKDKDTIFLLDYLSDLTDPSRKTLEFLKNNGYELMIERSFHGIGKVFEFKRVK